MLEANFISLAKGAYQVYDIKAREQMSSVVSSMLESHFPHAACFAGDWRGVQFFLEDLKCADYRESTVYMFDPSRMVVDSLASFGAISDAQLDGSVANRADPEDLLDWLDAHDLDELPQFTCVGTDRFYFMQNEKIDAAAPILDGEPMSMVSFVGAAGKMYLAMQG